MAVLTFQSSDNSILSHEFIVEVSMGTALENNLRLPQGLSVASHHAVITRSEQYQVPVLIDIAGDNALTQVNNRRVIRLKTLRHRDSIRLGDARLVFWEMIVKEVVAGSPLAGKTCPVCYEKLKQGDKSVVCPRCMSPHHSECWFYLPTCSYYGCGYPVQATMRRALASWIRFEKLEDNSELVKKKKICAARNERDRIPFKPDEYIAFCPDCETPFHTVCWFDLRQCPICQYNVERLMNAVFLPGSCEKPYSQEIAACRTR